MCLPFHFMPWPVGTQGKVPSLVNTVSPPPFHRSNLCPPFNLTTWHLFHRPSSKVKRGGHVTVVSRDIWPNQLGQERFGRDVARERGMWCYPYMLWLLAALGEYD